MNYLQQKRERFYYFIVTDLHKMRDDKLSILFDEEVPSMFFLSEYTNQKYTTSSEVYLARFWKDKMSAMRTAEKFTKQELNKGNKVIFSLQSMNRKEFLKSIPDLDKSDDAFSSYVYLRNKKFKDEEFEYLEELTEFRKQYKAISAYEQVENPYAWLNCPKCGLKPIIWTFDNGRSTACGCGENDYRHHSIQAESIMSYVTRNKGSASGYDRDELRKNWNHWCETGEFNFEPNKERW